MAEVAQADKGKDVTEGSRAQSKSRSSGRDETTPTTSRKKKHVVNFHYAQDHMLCDEIHSSAGFLCQLTWSDMALPKVPELAESEWYRMMASTITGVSVVIYYIADLLYFDEFFMELVMVELIESLVNFSCQPN